MWRTDPSFGGYRCQVMERALPASSNQRKQASSGRYTFRRPGEVFLKGIRTIAAARGTPRGMSEGETGRAETAATAVSIAMLWTVTSFTSRPQQELPGDQGDEVVGEDVNQEQAQCCKCSPDGQGIEEQGKG